MEMKKVLKYAMEIGECMLVSGAGVSRVEDTISRICKAYGAKEANVFSITSSIVTTIEDEKGEILTQTKRIKSYKTDFTKLDELNQLSRYMCKELPEEEEVKRKIAEIKKGKFVVFTEEVLTSAVIAAAWTSFYGGGVTEGIIAMIAGAFVAVLARYIKILAPNEMVLNFLLSFFVAAFAYISAKFGLTEDYGKIIIGNIMLLVPGVAFVNALRDMIGGDMMSGITALNPVPFVKMINVVSAEDMYKAVMENAPACDIVVKAAAVADYRPETVSDNKIKKTSGFKEIKLEETTDIIAALGRYKAEKNMEGNGQNNRPFLCGFSMETQNVLGNSKAKLEKKNIDMIVANNLRTDGAGFGADTNIVTIITKDDFIELDKMSKFDVAHKIFDNILSMMDN